MEDWLTPEIIIISLLAVAGIAVSIVLALRLRSRKELSFEILQTISLLSVEEAVKGRVKILFDDEPVQDLRGSLAIG